MVKASRRAWVGCSCEPSPALMIDAGSRSASIFGAPGYLWRMTIMSGAMAIRFSAVSISVSPFSTDEPATPKLRVSAERRLSAISNETRVRVGGDGLADDVGVDGELAMPAVDEHGQHDRLRAAEVDQRVERGAHRPSGIEHVVDQHHHFVVDRLGELGRLDHRLRRDGGEV